VYSSFAGLKKQDNCRLVRKPITRSLLLPRFPSPLPISNHLRTSCTFFSPKHPPSSLARPTHHALHTTSPLIIHPSIAAIILYIEKKTSIPFRPSFNAARFRLRKQRFNLLTDSFLRATIHTYTHSLRPRAIQHPPQRLSSLSHRPNSHRPNSEDCPFNFFFIQRSLLSCSIRCCVSKIELLSMIQSSSYPSVKNPEVFTPSPRFFNSIALLNMIGFCFRKYERGLSKGF